MRVDCREDIVCNHVLNELKKDAIYADDITKSYAEKKLKEVKIELDILPED